MLVLVAPGQGAQKPGLLTPWLELPGVRTLALKTPDDLVAARELIAEHTQTA